MGDRKNMRIIWEPPVLQNLKICVRVSAWQGILRLLKVQLLEYRIGVFRVSTGRGLQTADSVPVYYSVFVQELQCKRNLGRVKSSPWFVEFTGSLDLKHKIATVYVLHNEKQTFLRQKSNSYHMVIGKKKYKK